MDREETLVIQGFDIVTKLSSGGMGDVLLARRKGVHGFEKLLAVKTIRGDLAKREDIRSMFQDEASLVARLAHPAIAQVYDFGEEDGALYLAMEYVPGIALNKLLVKRQRALPPYVAARIIAEVCRGLHAAHELTNLDGDPLGVVHRDVSPGNVILTFDGHVKILDFGIAFMAERESPDTQLGELKGKPSYMAPEQLRGERVDRRSDLYSAGVVFHEMLTGRKLFSKQNVVATALAVERGEAPAPSTIVDLPDGFDEIAMKALERHAHNRFEDARAMAHALDELIQREPTSTLEQFVEDELGEEQASHKEWLHEVLSGSYTTSGTYEQYAEEKSRASLVPAAIPEPDPSAAEAHPLVDSTTLIPPSQTEESPAVPIRRKGPNPALVAVGIFMLAVLLFFGVRQLGAPGPEAIQPIAPLEAAPPPIEVARSEATGTEVAEALPEGDAPPPEVEVPEVVKTPEPEKPEPTKKKRRRIKKRRTATPPAPPPTKTVVADTYGYVTIGANPYALVRINGKEIGSTPVVRKRLPVGDYKVELIGPDTGDVRMTKKLTLREGAHERIMQR
ncbi:MAG: serine/threonine-protein kinase [Deltaproteobacteria bacterium]|jgi:serine/threonine protein kinase